MFITMKETREGCPDGFTRRTYEKGETYDLAAASSLADAFLAAGWAEPTKLPAAAQTKPGPKATTAKPGPAEEK